MLMSSIPDSRPRCLYMVVKCVGSRHRILKLIPNNWKISVLFRGEALISSLVNATQTSTLLLQLLLFKNHNASLVGPQHCGIDWVWNTNKLSTFCQHNWRLTFIFKSAICYDSTADLLLNFKAHIRWWMLWFNKHKQTVQGCSLLWFPTCGLRPH